MTTTADKTYVPAEARCFAPRRFYLVVGVIGGVFFSVIGVASTVAAYWNIDGSFPQPKLAALNCAVIFSGFTLLAVWIILACLRERLYLTSKTIIQHGVIRSRTIYCADIIHINWRRRPSGGSIVIQTPAAKVKIELGNFTSEEREVLIRFFREACASELQDNWPLFEAWRRQPPRKPASRDGILITAAVLMMFVPVFVYCWFAGLGAQYLFIGVIIAIAAICYLWRLRSYKGPGATKESAVVQERTEC